MFVQHMTSAQLDAEMSGAEEENREVSEAAARTIASRWQSPGTVGWALAAFASGAEIDWQSVYDDLSRTVVAEYATVGPGSRRELDLLGIYLLAHRW